MGVFWSSSGVDVSSSLSTTESKQECGNSTMPTSSIISPVPLAPAAMETVTLSETKMTGFYEQLAHSKLSVVIVVGGSLLATASRIVQSGKFQRGLVFVSQEEDAKSLRSLLFSSSPTIVTSVADLEKRVESDFQQARSAEDAQFLIVDAPYIREPAVQQCVVNARQTGCTVVILTPYLPLIPTSIRHNADCFLLSSGVVSNEVDKIRAIGQLRCLSSEGMSKTLSQLTHKQALAVFVRDNITQTIDLSEI